MTKQRAGAGPGEKQGPGEAALEEGQGGWGGKQQGPPGSRRPPGEGGPRGPDLLMPAATLHHSPPFLFPFHSL